MTAHSRMADLTLQLSRRPPMARRHTGSRARHTIVALALAVALSGAAANVAAARGGGGGGHGGGSVIWEVGSEVISSRDPAAVLAAMSVGSEEVGAPSGLGRSVGLRVAISPTSEVAMWARSVALGATPILPWVDSKARL